MRAAAGTARRNCEPRRALRFESTDVVVIGAGAAGLAAARAIDAAGLNTVVLEARERIGGRVLTFANPPLPVPVDVGGEFVHGANAVAFALLRAAGSVAVDTSPGMLQYVDGALRESEDPFEVGARVLGRARDLREDTSIEAFTAHLPDGERAMTRMIVEGFDAADPARASTLALAAEWGDANGQTSRQFRPLGGYAPVMRALAGAVDPERSALLLGTAARAIRYDAGGVRVEAERSTGDVLEVRARAALVTVPVGVLQAGLPAFDPPLPTAKADALGALIMGPVVKLALHFRRAFWESLEGGRFRDVAFFQRRDARFPTFWTLLPLRAPILIAWSGGPKADLLRDAGAGARTRAALDDLAVLFGPEARPHDELVGAYQHDWDADPFSRGAYSYVATGGCGAREALAAPVGGRLFFAGEATASAGESGTVGGALESGERAAREIVAALGVSAPPRG